MNPRYVVVGMMLTATTVTGAKEPVSIRVSPEISFAPANVVIRTSVEPATENRSIEVIAESGEFYRSSTIQLEGDRAPKTTMLEFRALPPGNYDVSASVIGSGGQRRAVAHMQVKVLGSEGIPE
jgi:predicted phage tail protein